LAVVMVLGFTTPEKRTNSSPCLRPICFSPDTSRFPLGSTSITVHRHACRSEVGSDELFSPLPLKLLVSLADERWCPPTPLKGRPSMVGTPAVEGLRAFGGGLAFRLLRGLDLFLDVDGDDVANEACAPDPRTTDAPLPTL
jgi:hypothetical protein